MPILHIAIIVGGVISLLVANGHRQFYAFFGWRETFQKVSALDAKVFYTIHLFLIPVFLLYAYLSFFHTQEMAEASSPIVRVLLVFYSFFWFCRGVWQIVYFRGTLQDDPKRAGRVYWVVVVVSVVSGVIYAAPVVGWKFGF
jgi:hypothetical protein